jgi:NAD(P)-dependent dehydrogenase (short-subunit alcohol dehydrogenase family)
VDLDGKVAIVTGGASGLGRATCEALVAANAKVLVVDLDEARGSEVASELAVEFLAADVARLEDNHAFVQAATERFGGVDLVHLNAGIGTGCGLGEDFELGRYRRAMGVNLDGVVFGVHAALPALEARGGGAIVATASLAGLTGMPHDPVYTANKHAVVGLVRGVGPVLAQRGIRLNAVCPGFAESPIIDPIRGMLAEAGIPIVPAESVAETVLELFTSGASGQCWYVQPGRPAEPFKFRGIPGPR